MREQRVILIVDDQDIVRKLIRTLLRLVGYATVLEAAEGKEAMDIIDTSERPIDLLISDFHLGHDMNGIQLARAITDRCPQTRVLLISADHSRGRDIEREWRFVEKPLAPAALLCTIEELLAEQARKIDLLYPSLDLLHR